MASAKFLKKVLRFLFLNQTLISHLTLSETVSFPKDSLNNLTFHVLQEIGNLPESEFLYDSQVIEIVPKQNNTLQFSFIGNEITPSINTARGDLVIPKLGNNNHPFILLEFREVIAPKSWKVMRKGFLVLWKSASTLQNHSKVWTAAVVYPRVGKQFYFEWDFFDPAIPQPSSDQDNLLEQLEVCMNSHTFPKKWNNSDLLGPNSDYNGKAGRIFRRKRSLLSLNKPLHHEPLVSSIVRSNFDGFATKKPKNGTGRTLHTLALASAVVANSNSTKNAQANSVSRVGGHAVSTADNRGFGNSTSTSVVSGKGENKSAMSVAQTAHGGVASARSLYVGYQPEAQEESDELQNDAERFRVEVDQTFDKTVDVDQISKTNPVERRKRNADSQVNSINQMTCSKLMNTFQFPLNPGKRKLSPEGLRNLADRFLLQAYKSISIIYNKDHEHDHQLRWILMESQRDKVVSQFDEHQIKLSMILTPTLQRRLKTLLLLLMKHEKRREINMERMLREVQLLKALLRMFY